MEFLQTQKLGIYGNMNVKLEQQTLPNQNTPKVKLPTPKSSSPKPTPSSPKPTPEQKKEYNKQAYLKRKEKLTNKIEENSNNKNIKE